MGSAVIGETVSRIISSLTDKDEEKTDVSDHIERLELAHIKMEVALNISNRWQISDMPLLRWRSKLKRAAQECNDTLRQCKRRVHEQEQIRHHISQSSFPRRIVHATKSFISSFLTFGNEDCTSKSVNVRRFERFADGANEFLKFLEFGGTPRDYMFFDPLIGHLLAGKTLRYQVLQGSKFSYFGIRPMNFEERGVEAMIGFADIDFRAPTKGFRMSFMLRLSGSTDIFGVIIKCMQLLIPHFKFAAEDVKRKLLQLPTQDFSLVPYSASGQSEYWINVHNTMTKWCRPNPICCDEYENSLAASSSSTFNNENALSSSRLLSQIFPEEVILLLLHCHVSVLDENRNRLATSTEHGAESSPNQLMHHLKLGILVIPHDTPEDQDPSADSYALEVIDENEHETVYNNACLQDLDEKLLPKAKDYLCQNPESKIYQICLKTGHGSAHICVEKMKVGIQRTRRIIKDNKIARNKLIIQKQDNRLEQWKQVAKDLVKIWVVRASDKLKGSIQSWAAVHKLP